MTQQFIFLDTNFLISTQIEGHPFHEKALNVLKTLDAHQEIIPVTHPLVFDEFWYVLIGLWKRNLKFSKQELTTMLLLATDNIFKFRRFKLLSTSLSKKDLLQNIILMGETGLRPRDALIVTIMKKESIAKIVSFDMDFDPIKGITRVAK